MNELLGIRALPIVIGARRLFLECGNGLRPVAVQSATLYHNEKRKATPLSAWVLIGLKGLRKGLQA